jgi:hypothetical protein
MRTFPRELANLREIVEARGAALRKTAFRELDALRPSPAEPLQVQARPATIAMLVERVREDRLRVVVVGLMPGRLLAGNNVALDGFYKDRDETVTPMADDELEVYG